MSTLSGPKGPRPHDARTGAKGEPMAPIPSASLVVLCPVGSNDGKSHGGSGRYATLMVQRSARDGSSFRSAVVFPGGALDLADEEAVERASKDGLSACGGSGSGEGKGEWGKEEAYMHSLRLCALRETFEETGLLLVPSEAAPLTKSRAIGPAEAGIEAGEWARLREEIHNDARAFTPFLSRVIGAVSPSTQPASGASSLSRLAPISHHSNWVTPSAVVRPAKRFDAHFFLTVLEGADALGPLTSASTSTSMSQDLLNLSADGTETTSLRLATADELVELAMDDHIVLFPPQFYILADLAAVLRNSQTPDPVLPPLVFRHPSAPARSPSNSNGVTTVEEEPRGLHPQSKYQFERRADGGGKGVTSVEPQARPDRGSNVSEANLQWRRGVESKSSSIEVNSSGREEEKDEPFVFPLVLPGDFMASRAQQEKMSGAMLENGDSSQPKPLNRVYVTPRSREEGGGLTVRGARRRGLPGLMDFEEGAQLEEMGADEEAEPGGTTSRARL